MLFQEKKLRNQPPEERLKEVIDELLEYQLKYGADSYKDAFPEGLDGDQINAVADYYEWEALEEEYLE
jgi:hypothetical protein